MRTFCVFLWLHVIAVLLVSGAEESTDDSTSDSSSGNNGNKVVGDLLNLVKSIPSLKNSLEKSGLSFDELELLLGQKNLFGQIIDVTYKLCPICGQVTDLAAKTNVELRVLLALARGKSPNLFDLFKMASTKSENMYESYAKASFQVPVSRLLWQKVTDPNHNLTEIYEMMTGRKADPNPVLDDDKYTSSTKSARKNRHLEEVLKFFTVNWKQSARVLRDLGNLPPDFPKILQKALTMDYSMYRFTFDQGLKLENKKYLVANNKNKLKEKYTSQQPDNLDPEKDEDIIHQLYEVRVVYPQMVEQFKGPNGNKAARKALIHLLQETIEIFNRLLS